jgi:hypothetical protein
MTVGAETISLLEQGGGEGKASSRDSSRERPHWLRSRPFATTSAALGLLGLVFATLAVGTRGRYGGASGIIGGGAGLKSLDLKQPYLGALDCEAAFTVPAEGPSDRFSYTFVKLISFADFVYVLCVDCSKVAVPSPWRGKVRLVDGKKIDEAGLLVQVEFILPLPVSLESACFVLFVMASLKAPGSNP